MRAIGRSLRFITNQSITNKNFTIHIYIAQFNITIETCVKTSLGLVKVSKSQSKLFKINHGCPRSIFVTRMRKIIRKFKLLI